MKAKPYVGITGPVNNQEVQDICRGFSDAGYTMNSSHIPMLGFLVSYKTLNNQPTKNRRYPLATDIPALLHKTNNRVLTMIHYNSKETSTLSDQITQIFDGIYDDGLCRAIQLNIFWPDVDQVRRIKDKFPEMQIVFQASHKAMEYKSPEEIANGIKSYGDSLSYVLIDPSGGRGLLFDLENSLAVYSELKEQVPDLTIGFAGGFTGKNVAPRLAEIIERTGETGFCIDAEGGLRDKISSEYGDDLLNIKKVRAYLQSAPSLLK